MLEAEKLQREALLERQVCTLSAAGCPRGTPMKIAGDIASSQLDLLPDKGVPNPSAPNVYLGLIVVLGALAIFLA